MAFTNFWRGQHDTKYVSTHLMQKNTMAVLPGVEQKLQLQNHNQVVLIVFSRPAIIMIFAFVLEVGEKINLFWNQDQGVGCDGKEKKEQNH
jgi:hypothetical protein